MSILIKNARVIDPSQNIDEKINILVEDGKISKISKSIKETARAIIDAENKTVTPGFIDMHTHTREPGYEYKEDIYTASKAAARGGFTTICAMPNSNPACDNQETAEFIKKRAEQHKLVNVIPIGAITKKREGAELADLADLKEAGCLAISDDGNTVTNSGVLRRAMEYASMLELLVISHCEDKSLAGNGVMNESFTSTKLGFSGIPNLAESIIVARDILISELAGARLHIAHTSCKESIEIIKQAKKKNKNLSAETCPHYFSLTDASLETFNTNAKVNPPLRTKEDVKAIKDALNDGTIDAIATDHAPHIESEKELEFNDAPFGMIGLQTALALSLKLIDEKIINWPRLVELLSTNPAKILNLNKGSLKEGCPADITIIDPVCEWVVTKEIIESKSKNTPFMNLKMKGCVTDLLVGGKIILKNSNFVA